VKISPKVEKTDAKHPWMGEQTNEKPKTHLAKKKRSSRKKENYLAKPEKKG